MEQDHLKTHNWLCDRNEEIASWKERFPQYEYRPQDNCVALKFGK